MKNFKSMVPVVVILLLVGISLSSQSQTATLKISNVYVEVNGEKVETENVPEVVLSDGIMAPVVLFEQNGLRYGHEFTYKKGTNRLKLVRRGYALKSGSETKFGKKKKDMQEMKTSIPGTLNKKVTENIVLDKDNLESIFVSFNYELIYK
jgi:hypothetical protein